MERRDGKVANKLAAILRWGCYMMAWVYLSMVHAAPTRPPPELYLIGGPDVEDHPQGNFAGIPKPGGRTDLIVKIHSQPHHINPEGARVLLADHQTALNILTSHMRHMIAMHASWGGFYPRFGYLYRVVPTANFYSVSDALQAAYETHRHGHDQNTQDFARALRGILQTQPQVAMEYFTTEAIPAATILAAEVYYFNDDGSIDQSRSHTVPNDQAQNPPAPAINPEVYPVTPQAGTFYGGVLRGIRRLFSRPPPLPPVQDDRQPLVALEAVNVDLDLGHLPGCSSGRHRRAERAAADDASFDACFTEQINAYPLLPWQAAGLAAAVSWLIGA
jgi:hypothetical protein